MCAIVRCTAPHWLDHQWRRHVTTVHRGPVPGKSDPALGSGHRHRQAIATQRCAGGAGFLGASGLLAACGSGGSSASGGGAAPAASGTLTFGSNQSDAVPKQAYAQLVTGFNDPNIKVTTQHGRPQHVPGEHQQLPAGPARTTSSPGSRATACSSSPRRAWSATSATSGRTCSGMPDAIKTASTGDDGKQYFVPFDNYPWAVFYRPSVFQAKGYQVPKTLDELVDPVHADAEGRPRPDRVRRQGRLARDGHVRPPQPADQRLRLPRQT